MPCVELRFPPAAGHVRTARLVAVAVARRAGIPDERLDEVRLGVGEACARAVRRSSAARVTQPVLLRIDDGGPQLIAEVVDAARTSATDEPVVVALLQGLADEVRLTDGPGGGPGGVVRLAWNRKPQD